MTESVCVCERERERGREREMPDVQRKCYSAKRISEAKKITWELNRSGTSSHGKQMLRRRLNWSKLSCLEQIILKIMFECVPNQGIKQLQICSPLPSYHNTDIVALVTYC